jgi:hypothetical protein
VMQEFFPVPVRMRAKTKSTAAAIACSIVANQPQRVRNGTGVQFARKKSRVDYYHGVV